MGNLNKVYNEAQDLEMAATNAVACTETVVSYRKSNKLLMTGDDMSNKEGCEKW